MSGPTRHVLLDADGVLQTRRGGWVESVRPYVGERAEEFMQAAWRAEAPCLRGDGDFLELLAAQLTEYDVTVPVDEVYGAVWRSIDLVPTSIALVHRLRTAGYGVHLGTNQERHRATYMRTELGLDELFDVSCYSWELGVLKSEPSYFLRVAELLGAHASEILFVDDSLDNVETARSVGLTGIHWSFTEGLEKIESRLAAHGVTLDE